MLASLTDERNHAREIPNNDTIGTRRLVRIKEHGFEVRTFRALHIPSGIVANEDRLLRRNAESRKSQADR